MKTSMKLAIAALAIIVIGVALSMAGYENKGSNLFNIRFNIGNNTTDSKLITKSEKLNSFTDIDIDTDIDNIEIVSSDQYRIELAYDEAEGDINYYNDNGTLTIKPADKLTILDINFNANYQSSSLKIYVPQDAKINSAKIDVDDGNINISGIDLAKASIDNSYGSVILSSLVMEEAIINADDGNIELKDITAKEVTLDNSYGNVTIDSLVADNLECDMNDGNFNGSNITINNKTYLDNDYGNVEFAGLSTDSLEADLEDGNIKINELKCNSSKIDNEYGDIELNYLGDENEFNYSLDSEYGTVTVGGIEQGDKANKESGEKSISAQCENGNINITFN